MSRSKYGSKVTEPGLGAMMTAAEVRRLEVERDAIGSRVIEILGSVEASQEQASTNWQVIDLNLEGSGRLVVDMAKTGVDNFADLIELASLRKRPIRDNRMHDYRWIHTHVCEYLKQFHPSENQALLAQARTAR